MHCAGLCPTSPLSRCKAVSMKVAKVQCPTSKPVTTDLHLAFQEDIAGGSASTAARWQCRGGCRRRVLAPSRFRGRARLLTRIGGDTGEEDRMRRTLLHLHMFYISGIFSLEICFEKYVTCISRAISSSSKGRLGSMCCSIRIDTPLRRVISSTCSS